MENEKRLIDANALKSEFEWLKSVVNESSKDEVMDVMQRIDNAPTVDAVEVIHASWVDVRDYCGDYMCSNCKELYRTKTYNYCPNCGAKMDGGVSDG